MLHHDAEGTVLARHADSVGNYKGRRFNATTRLCGLQLKEPIHGSLFSENVTQPRGYPCRLDESGDAFPLSLESSLATLGGGFLSATGQVKYYFTFPLTAFIRDFAVSEKRLSS